jgi:DNA repair protein RadD
MQLRPRQVKAIEDVRAAFAAGRRAPCLVAPTGMGKTHTAAQIIRNSIDRGKTVWFLAHLREILQDTCQRLDSVGIQYGCVMAGHPRLLHRPVQVVSVQTAARRVDLPKPDLIIIDECHLAIANTYRTVINAAGSPLLLGLTGSPARLDGRGLGEMFDEIIPTCSTRDLIDEGLLAPIRYYAPGRPDLSNVAIRAGDYASDQLADAMDRSSLTGDAVAHYQRMCPGKRAVVFCTTIKHAEHVAEQFNAAGFASVAISGKSNVTERANALSGLRSGELQVVCNAQLWAAGVDVPAIECIILLRPTKSLTFYLQSIGRGLRTAPGKEACIVLDHAGCVFEHGAPDAPRQWSLDAKRKRKKQPAPSVRECPSCFAAHEPAPVCPLCGFEYPKSSRGGPDQVDGDLTAIDLRRLQQRENAEKRRVEQQERVTHQRNRLNEQSSAKTEADLVQLARQRGYNNPTGWARHVLSARKKMLGGR